MKGKFLILFLICLASCSSKHSFSQANTSEQIQQNPFHLQLQIKGFSNGWIKLLGIYGDQNYGIDSFYANATGKVAYKLDSALTAGMYFIVFPDNVIVQILVDEQQQFSFEFDKADIVNSMKVSGSLDNELFYKNLKFESLMTKRMDTVQKQMSKAEKGSATYLQFESQLQKLKDERKAHLKWFLDNYPENFFTKFKTAGQNPELRKLFREDGTADDEAQIFYYRNDYWNAYDFADVRLLRTPVYFNKLKRYLLEITPQIPDSIIKYADYITVKSKANKELFKYTANWIALHYKEAKLMGRESVYVFMVEKFWTPDQVYWSKDYEIQRLRMQAKEMKVSLLGNRGENITGLNENNQQVSLYDIKAPVTVVFVFSYDCPNCKKETPKLMKVYNEWKDKGLDVFTICIDGDKEIWKKYLKENNMTFRNIFDPSNTTNFRAHYWFEATPGMFVLNKDHKIIASNIGSESLEVIMKKEMWK